MRPVSREVLAREAAARVAAVQVPLGRCVGQGDSITTLEAALRRAGTRVRANAVVAEFRGEFCHDCPALMACAEWAKVQEYSGLAAGAAYVGGARRELESAPSVDFARPGPARTAS